MKDLISVIIPVYNVKAYLIRCVNSVICQDYKELEIILVDDGSTDGSGKLCDQIAESDKRISVIHKKNEGLGEARNTGMQYCHGKYIFFIDSDDYIMPDIIEKLYRVAIDRQAQIVSCGYKSGKKRYYCSGYVEYIDSIEATAKMFICDGLDANAVCKLYVTNLFDGIRYPNCAYEVVPVTYRILLRAKKIISTGICGYYIEKRNGSITRSELSNNNWLYIQMSYDVYKKMNSTIPELSYAAYTFYLNALITMAEKAQESSKDGMVKKKIMDEFMVRFIEILRDANVSSRKKYIAILVKYHIYVPIKKLYTCLFNN